jgi:hypothetical protein
MMGIFHSARPNVESKLPQKRSKRHDCAFVIGLAMALSSWSQKASAETPVPPSNGDGLDTHLYRPALDSKGFFHTNGTDVLGANDVSFGFIIDYGYGLLRAPNVGQRSTTLLDHSIQGTLHFNYGIANRAAVGLSVPINLMFGENQVKPDGSPALPGQWSTSQVAEPWRPRAARQAQDSQC